MKFGHSHSTRIKAVVLSNGSEEPTMPMGEEARLVRFLTSVENILANHPTGALWESELFPAPFQLQTPRFERTLSALQDFSHELRCTPPRGSASYAKNYMEWFVNRIWISFGLDTEKIKLNESSEIKKLFDATVSDQRGSHSLLSHVMYESHKTSLFGNRLSSVLLDGERCSVAELPPPYQSACKHHGLFVQAFSPNDRVCATDDDVVAIKELLDSRKASEDNPWGFGSTPTKELIAQEIRQKDTYTICIFKEPENPNELRSLVAVTWINFAYGDFPHPNLNDARLPFHQMTFEINRESNIDARTTSAHQSWTATDASMSQEFRNDGLSLYGMLNSLTSFVACGWGAEYLELSVNDKNPAIHAHELRGFQISGHADLPTSGINIMIRYFLGAVGWSQTTIFSDSFDPPPFNPQKISEIARGIKKEFQEGLIAE